MGSTLLWIFAFVFGITLSSPGYVWFWVLLRRLDYQDMHILHSQLSYSMTLTHFTSQTLVFLRSLVAVEIAGCWAMLWILQTCSCLRKKGAESGMRPSDLYAAPSFSDPCTSSWCFGAIASLASLGNGMEYSLCCLLVKDEKKMLLDGSGRCHQ